MHKHKSHFRSYLKWDEKWARIKEDLCSHPDFQQHRDNLSPKSLRAKFARMRNAVSKKFALESKGANLSCLDEDNVSDSERMLIEMVGDELATTSMKEEEKNKDRIMKKQMLVHEAKMLTAQSGAAYAHHLRLDASKDSVNMDEDSQKLLGILEGDRSPSEDATPATPATILLKGPFSRDRSTSDRSSSSVPTKDFDLYRVSNSLAQSLEGPSEMVALLVEERRFDMEQKRRRAEFEAKKEELELEHTAKRLHNEQERIKTDMIQSQLMMRMLQRLARLESKNN